MKPLVSGLNVLLLCLAVFAQAEPLVDLPPSGISAAQLALVINERDPLSQQIGLAYQQLRAIPEANIIRVSFSPGKRVLSRSEFATLEAQFRTQTPGHVQAYALAWATPYRVDCMSITSAIALGFDPAWCASGCKMTRNSEYYNSDSRRPFDDHGLRPAMMLAATNFVEARRLIERGVKADGRLPRGHAYLVQTSDPRRNPRSVYFEAIAKAFGDRLSVHVLHTEFIRQQYNVMFYFTGRVDVPEINTNYYLPGAIADHLTSSGGQLVGGSQMSALRWLEAGVTASYGTVVEPCAFVQKFPSPAIVLRHYLGGNTLIEAYWKSVRQPGQGVFIGEPLASPWRGYRWRREQGNWYVESPVLRPGAYRVLARNDGDENYKVAQELVPVVSNRARIMIEEPLLGFYRIERHQSP